MAHKRKGGIDTGNANDEISGTGDIANLGSVVLAYDADKDSPDTRLLKVTKNRLFG